MRQRLAERSTLELAVRNAGDETIPDPAVERHVVRRPGQARCHELAPAFAGDGQVVLRRGRVARGSIAVRVTDKPPKARVDPRTGKVIREKKAQDG